MIGFCTHIYKSLAIRPYSWTEALNENENEKGMNKRSNKKVKKNLGLILINAECGKKRKKEKWKRDGKDFFVRFALIVILEW